MRRGDVIIDCSEFRLPFEWAVRLRGTNAIGKYGEGIARRWLQSVGIKPDRHHTFTKGGIPSFHPDLFDHSTRVAYEVKTGRHQFTSTSIRQIDAYERAIRTGQARLVAYLNVAFEGRVGLPPRYREELQKGGFRLFILK